MVSFWEVKCIRNSEKMPISRQTAAEVNDTIYGIPLQKKIVFITILRDGIIFLFFVIVACTFLRQQL